MSFNIIRQDITRMQVDAIVNAANTKLLMGGGVCGCIFNEAGIEQLSQACAILAPIKMGDAVITSAFDLDAKYIIHTASPRYKDGYHDEDIVLEACYRNSLLRALENGCQSVAFPLIASGLYGYPKKEAFEIASQSIKDFLKDHDLEIYLVVYDQDTFEISQQLLGDVQSYLDEHYIKYDQSIRCRLPESEDLYELKAMSYSDSLDDMINNLDQSFSATLFQLIDDLGQDDVEIYKRANIDRKLFSKIKSSKDYTPSKKTVLALAIALKLPINKTEQLLQAAGYSLAANQKMDVIVEYFIINNKYDIYEINEVLFKYRQPLLGSK